MTTFARACCTLDRVEPAAAGKLPMFHTIPPPGRYPSTIQMPDGEEVPGILVVDQAAYDEIARRFQAAAARPGFVGLLVDREHLSELPAGDSVAYAWMKTMETRPDGIWTGWDLTDLGEKAVGGKLFKFRSPVCNLEKIAGTDNEWRPVELVSAALTNVPRFRELAPSSANRGGAATGGGSADMTLIDRIRARLGKPDATEDEIFNLLDAALTAGETAKTELATVKARADQLGKEKIEREADEFVKEHGAKVTDTGKLKARYIADPAGTREAIGLFKAGTEKPAPRALGRDQGAKTPGERKDAEARTLARDRKAAIAAVRARDNCTHATAVVRAQREQPDLWRETETK
jgi:hypothetical protein